MTIIQGAVDIPDPTGQKSCFSILKKLIDLWGKTLNVVMHVSLWGIHPSPTHIHFGWDPSPFHELIT